MKWLLMLVFVASCDLSAQLIVIPKIHESTVQITMNNMSGGSGVIYDKYILTNAHVCEKKVIELFNHFSGRKTVYLKVVKISRKYDLCAIQPEITLGKSVVLAQEMPEIESRIRSGGHPHRIRYYVSEGLLGGRHNQYEDTYLGSYSSAPGSSGSGVFNEYGELIGINCGNIMGESNIAFFHGLKAVKNFIKELE